MTTEFLSFSPQATVADAIEALRNFTGGAESLGTLYLVDKDGKLTGAVPLVNLVLASGDTPLVKLTAEPLISCPGGANEREVAELFDKYNLPTVPVVDSSGVLTGVITADAVISLLRSML